MTEEEARERVRELAPHALEPLRRYADALIEENGRQNLIARPTEMTIWSRHLLDSLQLIAFARADDRTWLDIGSGPGLPGLVLAIAGPWQVTLAEPRARRVDFLRQMVDRLELGNVTVVSSTAEAIETRFDLVTARAVGSVDALLDMTRRSADHRTRFVLPKGKSARGDVDAARKRWHGMFHVEHSLTDPTSGIVVADRVCRR